MLYDAIVLAGGRSRRLGEVPKASLVLHGRTLLEHAISAAADARRIVVVGPRPSSGPSDARVAFTREDPPFSGPAAAVAAGLDALDGLAAVAKGLDSLDGDAAPDWLLVLACDLPHAEALVAAVTTTTEAVTEAEPRTPTDGAPDAVAGLAVGHDRAIPRDGPIPHDGAIPHDEPIPHDGAIPRDETGRLQPLAALYRRSALAEAVRRRRDDGGVEGASMFSLIRDLRLTPVPIAPGVGDDVDTWEDADRSGVERPAGTDGPAAEKEGTTR